VVTLNTLLIDLNTAFPSTAQAANNLVRCAFAATGLAILQIMINVLGIGWCFTVWAILGVLCVPLLLIERANGMKWRIHRLSTVTEEEVTIPDCTISESVVNTVTQDTCIEE